MKQITIISLAAIFVLALALIAARPAVSGPICDGFSNDTALIQAELDTKAVVTLPAGVCGVTTLTFNRSNVSLIGAGNSATVLRAYAGATILLSLGITEPVARVTVKDMLIDCANQAGVVGLKANSPVQQTNSLYLEDLQIDNCPGGALIFQGVGNSWVRNLIGSNNGAVAGAVPAVSLQKAASGVTTNSNHFYGLDMESCKYSCLFVGSGVDANIFTSTILDGGPAVLGMEVQGSQNMWFGLVGGLNGNGDFIRFSTGSGALGRLNQLHGVRFDYDPSATSGRVINLENTAGAAGLNSVFDLAVLTLPAGTTMVRDLEANGNFIINARTRSGQAGTLFDITNLATVVLP